MTELMISRARDRRRLRAMFAANAVVSGMSGAIALLSKSKRRRRARSAGFDGMDLAGGMWLALGVLSLAGLRPPRALRSVLAIQSAYRSASFGRAAPRLLHMDHSMLPIAGIFGAVVGATIPAMRARDGLREEFEGSAAGIITVEKAEIDIAETVGF